MSSIDSLNREFVIERYVDDIVGGSNFLEIKERLKSCLIQQKRELPNDELELEIMRHDPGLLTDIYIEQLFEEVSHV